MNEVMYLIAFLLMGAGAGIGDKLDSDVCTRPLNPVPLRAITGAAGLAAIGWFVYGFFPFSWWLPLVGVVAFATLGAFIIFHSLRSHLAPVLGMLFSFLGLVTAVLVIAVGA